jgi:serine O-acetyltransferase
MRFKQRVKEMKIINFSRDELNKLVFKQIHNNFNLYKNDETSLLSAISNSLLRTEKCFTENTNKYYLNDNKELIFSPYHSGQYSIFLYFASREAFLGGNKLLADKIYYLNKMLNCCDLYYEVVLPDIFFVEHPIGSVMGRASYSNFFLFQQNCTVGGNHDIYPCFDEFVWLFAGATVIGDANVGNNVFISANTYIKDETIPDNTIVFGKSPNLVLKHKTPEYFYNASPFKTHKDIITSQQSN